MYDLHTCTNFSEEINYKTILKEHLKYIRAKGAYKKLTKILIFSIRKE